VFLLGDDVDGGRTCRGQSACERVAVWTDVSEIRRLNIRPPLQSPLENIDGCQIMRELAYFHKVKDLSLAYSLPVQPPSTWYLHK